MPAHLVVLPPHGTAFSVALGQRAEIGSGAKVDVRIADPEVASTHIVIQCERETWRIVETRRPIQINGETVEAPRPLATTDLLTIGHTAIAFRQGSASTASPIAIDTLELCRMLNAFSTQLVSGASAIELTRWLLSDVVALTGGERVALVRFAGVAAETLGFVDAVSETFSAAEAELSSTVISRLRDANAPLLITDAAVDADLGIAPSIAKTDTNAVMCAPIRSASGRMVGALYVSGHGTTSFTKERLDVLTVYAAHATHLLSAAQHGRTLTKKVAHRGERSTSSELVGSSSVMAKVRQQIGKVAKHDISVLVCGATGTGKDLVARDLHRESPRNSGPFVAVNCGAIPEALLQSELFGHARGAFTNAVADRTGWIRSADGGTLFLDEIGEMPAAQQAMLLRVLQDKVVTPVGSEDAHPVDFRLVCATNRDLRDQVERGAFREDLYYRIADVTIDMPALAARDDDAVELAQWFLQRQRTLVGDTNLRFSAASLSAIRRCLWPGNVRELEARVRRAALLCEASTLEPVDLGLDTTSTAAAETAHEEEVRPLNAVRDAYLKRYVTEVVGRFGGNRTKAAKALGVSVRTVFKYLEQV